MVSLPVVLSVLLMGFLPLPALPSGQHILATLPLAPPLPIAAEQFPGKSLARALSASGAAILDLQSGQELFVRNAEQKRPVGSLTKLMTAIIIAESHGMDEVVTVPKDMDASDPSTLRLPPGSHFTVGDLLSALLIPSANDAADALARFHSGSEKAFVGEMNLRAQILGLRRTSFANASGLDSSGQWSTPRDMARLAAYAVRNPEIRARMSTVSTSIRSREGLTFALRHTHELLRGGGAVIAGKTGTTNAARQCLLTLVNEGGREYIVVLLGSHERYTDMRAVLRILSTLFA